MRRRTGAGLTACDALRSPIVIVLSCRGSVRGIITIASYAAHGFRCPVRTSATTSESPCAWAPCGDVTRGGGIPGVAIRQYAVWHDRHASDSRTLGYFRLEAR